MGERGDRKSKSFELLNGRKGLRNREPLSCSFVLFLGFMVRIWVRYWEEDEL